jgi:Tol biopolymer transport system component
MEAHQMRRLRSLLLSIGLGAALAGLVLAPVSASYPGQHNGRIAFGVRNAGGANIFSILPDGTGRKQLTTGAGFHLCPSFSADGRTIAYCSNVSGSWEIWTMRANGKNQHQLTHLGGFATFPDFSPDGSKIAFGGTEGADEHNEIYAVDAKTGGGLHALTSCAGLADGCFNDLPVWSPDGTKIAFMHGTYDAVLDAVVDEQVWVMDAHGGNPHPLTSDSAPKDQVPDWSPDSSRIAYAAGGFGDEGIWVMDADGGNNHQISGCVAGDPSPCAQGDDWGPAWSPDGKKIAFLRDLQALGITDRPVYVMDVDGSHQHRLTAAPALPGVPAWQPLGRVR